MRDWGTWFGLVGTGTTWGLESKPGENFGRGSRPVSIVRVWVLPCERYGFLTPPECWPADVIFDTDKRCNKYRTSKQRRDSDGALFNYVCAVTVNKREMKHIKSNVFVYCCVVYEPFAFSSHVRVVELYQYEFIRNKTLYMYLSNIIAWPYMRCKILLQWIVP